MFEIILYISIFLIFYVYLGYPLLLAIWSSLKRKANYSSDHNKLPKISMLISAYNEEDVISDKLENIKEMNYPAHLLEVFIGSDCSDDMTNKLIIESNISNLRLVAFEERRGKPAVLNDLAKMADGDILVFSDANSMFEPDALLKLIEPFSDSTIGGVVGNLSFDMSNIKNSGGLGETLYFKYENIVKRLESDIYSTIVANGAVYVIRKELYTNIPVTRLVADDMFIPLSIIQKGFRMFFRRDVYVSESPSLSVTEEYQKKVRTVASGMEVIKQFHSLLHPKFGFISFALWSHKILRWMVPFILVSVFVSNLLLINQSPQFQRWLIYQLSFYFSMILGGFLEKQNIKIMPLQLAYYFIIVNIAIVMGFVKFIRGKEGASWKRTRRK